jgi:cyclohexyl-isocyanide hydratase
MAKVMAQEVPMIDRRTMLAGAATLAAGGARITPGADATREDFAHPFSAARGSHPQVALLIYPGMTALDVLGPYHFLCFMGDAKIHLVTNQPQIGLVVSDAGLGIQPTTTMADCPRDLDLLLVPGGTDGTLRAARDGATIEFLQDRGTRARYISSVCTGSLVLGVAGLLRGRRATSHWTVVETLSQFGAIPTRRRVVEDGNVITAAGVSAGLDSGILLLERLHGRPLAEAAVLETEYAPDPPLRGGSEATARPEITRAVNEGLRSFIADVRTLRPAGGESAVDRLAPLLPSRRE